MPIPDPEEQLQFLFKVQRVLSDGALREALVARGLARAREFSWENSIRRVHGIYMEVLKS